MIRRIPFKSGHLDLMDTKDIYSGERYAERLGDSFHNGVDRFAGSLLWGGSVLGVFGGVLHHHGCMEVFTILSKEVYRYPIAFHKEILKLVMEYEKSLGLWRMQCTVRCEHTEAYRWARGLGFLPEGILKSYGEDKSDYYIFGRTRQ